MRCHVCEGETSVVFAAEVLQKYNVEYYCCRFCGFVQAENPFWLSEAYQNPINASDTGLLSRNILFSSRTAALILAFFKRDGLFVDHAGGFGVFTRLMRDIGFDFYWQDEFCTNLMARGFEYDPKKHKIEMVTAFEVFEHFAHPMKELTTITGIARNLVFSTTLIASPPPKPREWWYYSFHHGQHISFYTFKSLQVLASRIGLNLYSNGRDFHLLTEKKISRFAFTSVIRLSTYGLRFIAEKTLKSRTETDMHLLGGHDS